MSWAPHIKSLRVNTSASRGLLEFAALAQLQVLKLAVWNIVNCARGDALLRECQQLQELSYEGYLLPTAYPPSLQKLTLDLSRHSENYEQYASEDPGHLSDGIMLRLASLPDLQHLTLLLGYRTDLLPSVAAQRLPTLHCLRVQFDLMQSKHYGLDIRWLAAQPCKELWVHVSGHESAHAHMAAILHSFRQMRMQHFHLAVFSSSRMMYWSIVRAAQRVTLTLEGLAQPSILPSAPELHIIITERVIYDTLFSLQALLVAGSCVMIEKPAKHHVELCSSGAWDISRAQRMDKPWQLTISTASSLRGFPPALPSKPGTYFWQNLAAVAADWQQPDAWD